MSQSLGPYLCLRNSQSSIARRVRHVTRTRGRRRSATCMFTSRTKFTIGNLSGTNRMDASGGTAAPRGARRRRRRRRDAARCRAVPGASARGRGSLTAARSAARCAVRALPAKTAENLTKGGSTRCPHLARPDAAESPHRE